MTVEETWARVPPASAGLEPKKEAGGAGALDGGEGSFRALSGPFLAGGPLVGGCRVRSRSGDDVSIASSWERFPTT